MTTEVECVFKSSHPIVLAAEEDNHRRYREWVDAIRSFTAEYPNFSPIVVTFASGGSHCFKGLRIDDPRQDAYLGPLWRLDRSDNCWVPLRRSKAGKELGKRVDDLKVTDLKKLPGMPDIAEEGSRMYTPGQQLIDGTLWVTWGCSAESVEKANWSKVDLDRELWSEAKMSEYYLAIESVVGSTSAIEEDDN